MLAISIYPSRFSTDIGDFADDTSRAQVIVVFIVLILHVVFGSLWWVQPAQAKKPVKEMSVSISIEQAVVAQPKSQPLPPPQPKVRNTEKIVPRQVAEDAVEVMKAPVQTPAPSLPSVTAPVIAAVPVPVVETEPDFKAGYLHNPRPTYPLIARRMRYHGKVLLDVEVLSDGNAGQVKLHRSSGYEVLDKCALEVVQTWHFTPAKNAGKPITRWFVVPINFTLEETQA